MQIVFSINADSEANITDASLKLLAELPPVVALDYMQDVLIDAMDAYNVARERCGFQRNEAFVRP